MAPRQFVKTVNGVEQQFGSNHLGHFLSLLLSDLAKVKGIVANATSRSWTLTDPDYDNYNFDVSLVTDWTI